MNSKPVVYSRVVIAGERSGCGKTTVSLAIMNALSRKGVRVQGFKTGPDYLDTSHYEARTGVKGRNIDLWMTSPQHCLEIFLRNAANAQISVIEGVMGLYDGSRPDNTASTAHTAKFLSAPVILVLNPDGGAQTTAATALGLKMFDEKVNIAGFVLNRAASKERAEAIAAVVTEKTAIPYLGFMPLDDKIALTSRHLGLSHAVEEPVRADKLSSEVEIASKSLDIERIEKIAGSAPPLFPPDSGDPLYPFVPEPQSVRFAVARDKAFSFYYEDALEILSLRGCEIAPFSPLSEERLPAGADAVFIGGGFPELYCGELESNVPMRDDLRNFAFQGGTVYAECGGMMYLGAGLTDLNGRRFDMCGALEADFEMRPRLQSVGYREVIAAADAGFFRAGDREKGHEFHYSALSGGHAGNFFNITTSAGDESRGGMVFRNTVASYIHLNFLSSGIIKRIPARLKARAEDGI
ncbi:cobyrinate a,c-diamide synthase [Candidatus Mycalebacterium sp.]